MTTAGNHSKQNTNSSCFGQGIAVNSFKTRCDITLLKEPGKLEGSNLRYLESRVLNKIAFSYPPTTVAG